MKQAAVLVLFLLCLFPDALSSAAAETLSLREAAEEIELASLDMQAVGIEAQLYLVGYSGDKEAVKSACLAAIKDLEEIRKHIEGLKVPKELNASKDLLARAIVELEKTYRGAEKKSDDERGREFKKVGEFYGKAWDELVKAYNKRGERPDMPEKFSSRDEETKLILGPANKETYSKAIGLMKQKKFSEAYGLLRSLREKYRDMSFDDVLMLRMSDCIFNADSDIKRDRVFNYGYFLIEKILGKKRYTPILYETYYKWRTVKQMFLGGMSNTAEIPNKVYNARRREAVKVIKDHLAVDPEDKWAEYQMLLLLDLPNIARGGKQGNYNLNDYAFLYSDDQGNDEGTEDGKTGGTGSLEGLGR